MCMNSIGSSACADRGASGAGGVRGADPGGAGVCDGGGARDVRRDGQGAPGTDHVGAHDLRAARAAPLPALAPLLAGV
eukprot:3442065-Rhodomonas_salina.2